MAPREPIVLIDADSLLLRDRRAVANAARRADRAQQMVAQARKSWMDAQEMIEQVLSFNCESSFSCVSKFNLRVKLQPAVENARRLMEMAEIEEVRTISEYQDIFEEMESLHGPGTFEARRPGMTRGA